MKNSNLTSIKVATARACAAGLLGGTLGLHASGASAQMAYDLVSPPGVTSGFATAISSNGTTALVYLAPPNRSFIYAGGALTDPGTLGGTYTYLYALSGTGAVASGVSSLAGGETHAVRWTAASGLLDLGMLPGHYSSAGQFISADGSVVAGESNSFAGTIGFRWTAGTGMVALGTLGGANSYVRAMSSDGSTIVGGSTTVTNDYRAYRWTQATGIQDIGTLGGNFADAAAVSANGSVVVGNSATVAGETHAFRWTAGGMTDLGVLGGNQSYANFVSADGNAVAGNSSTASGGYNGFHWTAGTGMVDIGTLGGTYSLVNAISSNGKVLVGQSTPDDIRAQAFRWTQDAGIQSIEAWLADSGVTVSGSFLPTTALGVSADGSVVVGEAYDQAQGQNRPFIARGLGTSGGSGLMDVLDYQQSLTRAADSLSLPLRDADLVLHGAHGMPLQALLPTGQSTVWVAGDAGASDRRDQDTSQGVAEIGYSRGLSPDLQFKIAVGRTLSHQGLHLTGSARHAGTYLVPEFIWQPAAGLYASFSGYYNDGSVRVRRSYLNAGLIDNSAGEAGARTLAVRARLDGLNLWKWADMGLTPYLSLTHSRVRVDAYTESGGAFPASWARRSDSENVLRAGVDGTMALGGDMKLTSRLEAAHRFERGARRATGDVTGLFPFDVSTGGESRSWLRVGVGIDLPLGPGRLSTNLNATTRGGSTDYWLATSYRMSFW